MGAAVGGRVRFMGIPETPRRLFTCDEEPEGVGSEVDVFSDQRAGYPRDRYRKLFPILYKLLVLLFVAFSRRRLLAQHDKLPVQLGSLSAPLSFEIVGALSGSGPAKIEIFLLIVARMLQHGPIQEHVGV